MAFPLHASETSDKSETGREKLVSVPAESSDFFRSKKVCTGGAKMGRFLGRMWQKTSQVKNNILVCESVTFVPEVCQIQRVTFFVTKKKWQMWRHSPKSETGTWEEIQLRLTLSRQNRHVHVRFPLRIWFHTHLALCTCCDCFPNNMITMCQQSPRLWYLSPYWSQKLLNCEAFAHTGSLFQVSWIFEVQDFVGSF